MVTTVQRAKGLVTQIYLTNSGQGACQVCLIIDVTRPQLVSN